MLGDECAGLKDSLRRKGIKLSEDGKWNKKHECCGGGKKKEISLLDLGKEEDDHTHHGDNVWAWTKQAGAGHDDPDWRWEDEHRKEVQLKADQNK
jgi:hypothetical protein